MQRFPHLYNVSATAARLGEITVSASSLPDLATDSPAEFDGPGNRWSPETLLCAAVADCYILTFRALARLVDFPWIDLQCRVEGKLDRAEKVTRFVAFATHATLRIMPGADADKARELLEKSEERCLVANSLNGTRVLEAEVVTAG